MRKILMLLMIIIMTLSALASIGGDITGVTPPITPPSGENAERSKIKNPIYSSANDPWVVEHNGHYYYCFAGGDGRTGGVRVGEIEGIDKVTEETAVQVYVAPENTMYTHDYWAPELHYINGEWYIYVAADDGNNANHRMYVLKGTSQNPTEPFEMVGKITDNSDKWAIDGTVLTVGGEMYFVWSGWEGDVDGRQDLYIAHMSDPTTIDSERVMIATPGYAYEKHGMPIEEGPAAVYHGDDVFIFFSGSGSWTNEYCIGYLTLTGNDPMDADAWTKGRTPLLKTRLGVGYGPGHCSVVSAPDGSMWVVYHANLQKNAGWQGRECWISELTFTAWGTPKIAPLSRTVSFPKEKNK